MMVVYMLGMLVRSGLFIIIDVTLRDGVVPRWW